MHPSEVPPLLAGTFDKQKHIDKMRAKGKSDKEIEDWDTLVTEVCQAINSKQLVPTLRTQYMRTAFQIPFDATVRISLDTNLCMLTETGRLTMDQDRWFRDPSKPVPRSEITRFPHAVLEVKLQLTVRSVGGFEASLCACACRGDRGTDDTCVQPDPPRSLTSIPSFLPCPPPPNRTRRPSRSG